MALKIRLRQHGKKNHKVYRIVVSDSRSAREGRYVECIGWYNPFAEDANKFLMDNERLSHWVRVGAQPTDSVLSFIKKSSRETVDFLNSRKAVKRSSRREERRRAAVRKVSRVTSK